MTPILKRISVVREYGEHSRDNRLQLDFSNDQHHHSERITGDVDEVTEALAALICQLRTDESLK